MHRNNYLQSSQSSSPDSLTSDMSNDKKFLYIPKEVIRAMDLIGNALKYREGSFRVTLSYKGERLDIYKDERGKRFNCLRDAQETLIYINSLIKQKKFNPSEWKADQTFGTARAIEVWLELSDCSIEWKEKKKSIADLFLKPFFEEQRIYDIREINDMHIKFFNAYLKGKKDKRGKDFSDKYRYNILNVLKEFLHFHRASIHKMPEFPKISYQKPPIKWLDKKQQDEVFSCIPSQDLPIFTFMRYTGCRPSEAGGLLRENVILNHTHPYLVFATVLGKNGRIKPNTKTKMIKPLPIIEEIANELRPKEVTPFIFSKSGTPYTHHRLRHIWEDANIKANKKFGTPIVSLYQGLKHSLGCQRLNQGFSIYQIKELYGHTDIKTTERYAKYATEKLADVMRGKVEELGAKVVQTQAARDK